METRRQFLHIGVGGFALLLRWLTWPQAAALAATAIAFNLLVLPRLFPGVLRGADRQRPWTSGILLYPTAVLALVLVFPTRLDLVATSWVILAVGDGMATLVGTHAPIAPLPWNHQKSLGGLWAFVLFAGAAAAGMTWWSSPVVPDTWRLVAPIVAALLAGLAETAPVTLDDNVTVPVVAAAALWSTTGMHPDLLVAHAAALETATWALLAINLGAAALGWMARTVTAAGAVAGGLIGAVIVVCTGAAGWTVLIATFLVAALTTRLGQARKTRAGIAEARGGRRGPGNAIANTGIAAWAAVIAAGSADPTLAQLALVAALATTGSDTVASEVGKTWGRTTWLITTLRRVKPGTTGAVSLQGTLAGILSAVLLAAIGAWVGLVPAASVPLIALAATLASLLEGVIGATIEARGMLTNDAVNFVNSAIGAGIAILFWSYL